MTRYLLDVASYQGSLTVGDVVRAGFTIVNLKISHGLTQRTVHPDILGWVARAKAAGLGISTFHFLTGDTSGAAQAVYAYQQLSRLGLEHGTMHVVDVETNPVGPDATLAIVREYIDTMQQLLGRPVVVYTGDWWWEPKGWNVTDLTHYLHAAPNAGYPGVYPGDSSGQWLAGYGGWVAMTLMQYAVAPLVYPDGTRGSIDVSKSALRDLSIWTSLTGGSTMATWVLVPAAVALRAEFNRIAPNRDRASDGSVGDLAHQQEASDHNPDETGNTGSHSDADSLNEVHAIDVDMSGPWPDGFSMEIAVQFLLRECRAGREKRLIYIIYQRRIWSASSGWVQQVYTGTNPHDKHAHFSFSYITANESNTKTYGLEGLIDMATAEEIAAAVWAARPWGSPYDAADALQGAYAGQFLKNDVVPNPYADRATNPYITVLTALQGAAQADVKAALILASIAALDQVDSAQLAAALGPVLLPALLAGVQSALEGVEEGAVDLDAIQARMEAGLRRVLGGLDGATPPTAG